MKCDPDCCNCNRLQTKLDWTEKQIARIVDLCKWSNDQDYALEILRSGLTRIGECLKEL